MSPIYIRFASSTASPARLFLSHFDTYQEEVTLRPVLSLKYAFCRVGVSYRSICCICLFNYWESEESKHSVAFIVNWWQWSLPLYITSWLYCCSTAIYASSPRERYSESITLPGDHHEGWGLRSRAWLDREETHWLPHHRLAHRFIPILFM